MELIKIEKEKINQTIVIDEVEYLLVSKEQLKTLLQQNAEYKADICELKECIFGVLRVMGLFDEEKKTIKQSIKDGTEGYFKHILKALKNVVLLLAEAQLGMKGAERELLEKFAFIKTLIPLIEKHGE